MLETPDKNENFIPFIYLISLKQKLWHTQEIEGKKRFHFPFSPY